MRVDLEPYANPAVSSGSQKAAAAPPSKHKPLLQARRNQYEDYRNLKDRDFLSLHEEVTHLRQSVRDQERIIALLKEEKNRVLAELLQKGQEVQHYKDILKKPSSSEEKSVVEDLKRTLAAREASIDELKSEVIRLNTVHQSTLEDYDDAVTQTRLLEQRVLNAEQEAEHRRADADRLTENIRLLNEEMTARINAMNVDVQRAAEIGKRDATTDHHYLEEELESWKQKFAEQQNLLKRFQDEEQRQKGLAVSQQTAANEAVSEKIQLLAEIRRQQLLLAEMDDLKAQVEAFRVNQVAAEEVLREQLNVALLAIHEEKSITRGLMREVDSRDDLIAAKEREAAQLAREYEKRLSEAGSVNDDKHKQKIAELEEALRAVRQEKDFHEGTARATSSQVDRLVKELEGLRADKEALKEKADHDAQEKRQLQLEVHRLESSLLQAQHLLQLARADAEQALVTQERESDHWPRQLEMQRAEAEAAVAQAQRDKDAALAALELAAQHVQQLEAEIAALREAQLESDAIRHEVLSAQLQQAQVREEELQTALHAAYEEVNRLHRAVEEAEDERARASVEPRIDAAANEAAPHAEVLDLQQRLQMQEVTEATLRDELQRSQQELRDVTAAKDALEKKLMERFEKEKKTLQERLKAALLAKEDAEKSVDVRGQQLRQETDLRLSTAQEMAAARKEFQQQLEEKERALQALVQRHDTSMRERDAAEAATTAEVDRLKQQVASLLGQLDGLRKAQLFS